MSDAAALACANGFSGRVIHAVRFSGWTDAILTTFGVSAIAWLTCIAGLRLISLHTAEGAPTRRDKTVLIFCLLLIGLPVPAFSWVCLTLLASYVIATSQRGCDSVRGGSILLALTIPMLWSRVAFTLLAKPILAADATLVAALLGTERLGNTVRFVDGSGYLEIFAGCSSLANVSLAVLGWYAACQLFHVQVTVRNFRWCLLASGCLVVVNGVRIAAIGAYPQHYALLHGGAGAEIAAWASLVLIVAISAVGVRHELRANN
ncbi:hypothetical protein JNW90_14445 [Micromonospora sp. STR1s_5]|nr:hypothetical protein [Micromonospora sp. STR1s_5]